MRPASPRTGRFWGLWGSWVVFGLVECLEFGDEGFACGWWCGGGVGVGFGGGGVWVVFVFVFVFVFGGAGVVGVFVGVFVGWGGDFDGEGVGWDVFDWSVGSGGVLVGGGYGG
jgi:hypothetical protein